MAWEWRSWLVVGSSIPSHEAKRLRQDFSISDNTDLSERPVATFDRVGSKLVLGLEGKAGINKFFEELSDRIQASPEQSIRAISFAPVEVLRAAHGMRLWYQLRAYPVTWEGNDISVESDPFARRFIRIHKSELKAAESLGESQISNGEKVGTARLILDPVEVRLTEASAQASIAAEGGYWFLPPVRSIDHKDRAQSYFSSERLRFRHSWRKAFDLQFPDAEEPAAILAQRLIDDPLLRDPLLEGGAFCVEGGSDAKTQVALEINESDQISGARAAILLGEAGRTPQWVRGLVAELRRDVESIVPLGKIRKGNVHVDWAVAPGEMGPPRTATEGNWHLLDSLGKQLAETNEKHAAFLHESVLRFSNPGESFNHSHALLLFAMNYWRKPWGATIENPDLSGWTMALGSLLRNDAFRARVSPAQWAEEFQLTLTKGPGELRVTYAGNPSDEIVLHWRLLYPLGTAINPRTIVLDGGLRSRLDTQSVLA